MPFVGTGLLSIPLSGKGLQPHLLVIKRRGQALSVAVQAVLKCIDAEVQRQPSRRGVGPV